MKPLVVDLLSSDFFSSGLPNPPKLKPVVDGCLSSFFSLSLLPPNENPPVDVDVVDFGVSSFFSADVPKPPPNENPPVAGLDGSSFFSSDYY